MSDKIVPLTSSHIEPLPEKEDGYTWDEIKNHTGLYKAALDDGDGLFLLIGEGFEASPSRETTIPGAIWIYVEDGEVSIQKGYGGISGGRWNPLHNAELIFRLKE